MLHGYRVIFHVGHKSVPGLNLFVPAHQPMPLRNEDAFSVGRIHRETLSKMA